MSGYSRKSAPSQASDPCIYEDPGLEQTHTPGSFAGQLALAGNQFRQEQIAQRESSALRTSQPLPADPSRRQQVIDEHKGDMTRAENVEWKQSHGVALDHQDLKQVVMPQLLKDTPKEEQVMMAEAMRKRGYLDNTSAEVMGKDGNIYPSQVDYETHQEAKDFVAGLDVAEGPIAGAMAHAAGVSAEGCQMINTAFGMVGDVQSGRQAHKDLDPGGGISRAPATHLSRNRP